MTAVIEVMYLMDSLEVMLMLRVSSHGFLRKRKRSLRKRKRKKEKQLKRNLKEKREKKAKLQKKNNLQLKKKLQKRRKMKRISLNQGSSRRYIQIQLFYLKELINFSRIKPRNYQMM